MWPSRDVISASLEKPRLEKRLNQKALNISPFRPSKPAREHAIFLVLDAATVSTSEPLTMQVAPLDLQSQAFELDLLGCG